MSTKDTVEFFGWIFMLHYAIQWLGTEESEQSNICGEVITLFITTSFFSWSKALKSEDSKSEDVEALIFVSKHKSKAVAAQTKSCNLRGLTQRARTLWLLQHTPLIGHQEALEKKFCSAVIALSAIRWSGNEKQRRLQYLTRLLRTVPMKNTTQYLPKAFDKRLLKIAWLLN